MNQEPRQARFKDFSYEPSRDSPGTNCEEVGGVQGTIRDHLADSAMRPNPPNTELKQGFTVLQVAEKHGWLEPLVWSIALEGKDDLARFKALNWGLRTWDLWNWNDCDKRFGDDWPGRIPAQGNALAISLRRPGQAIFELGSSV